MPLLCANGHVKRAGRHRVTEFSGLAPVHRVGFLGVDLPRFDGLFESAMKQVLRALAFLEPAAIWLVVILLVFALGFILAKIF
jgi:hypothetical protein